MLFWYVVYNGGTENPNIEESRKLIYKYYGKY